MSKNKLLEVVWVDVVNVSGWQNPEDAIEQQLSTVTSVGFLIYEDDKKISLAQGIDYEGKILGQTIIPKGWIKKRRVLN